MSSIESFNETQNGLSRCCALGGLVYVECCLRDVSPRSRIVCDLVARLVTSLDELKLQPQNQIPNQVYGHWIFWAVFVGAAAAERNTSTADREKLVKWLGLVAGRFKHQPWPEIYKSLRRISWSERGGGLVGASLWEEIRRGD